MKDQADGERGRGEPGDHAAQSFWSQKYDVGMTNFQLIK